MKNILVLAYAISPIRGSEYSVAWNYIINMSTNNNLFVLYGCAGTHLGDFEDIDDFVKKEHLPNVTFIKVEPDKIASLLNILNKKDVFRYFFYFAYNRWQKLLFTTATEVISSHNIEIIHYLGPIGYREPGYLWKLNIPYIWGPIGGMKNPSIKLFQGFNLKNKLKFGIKRLVNNIQFSFGFRFHKAVRRANVLLVATSNEKLMVEQRFNRKVYHLPENAIIGEISLPNNSKFENPEYINLIFVGTLEARKSVITILRALTHLKTKRKFILHIIGDGPEKNNLQRYAISKGLNNIKWYGNINREDVLRIFKEAHIHIITSVSEGNPTTVWEAMSQSVPTVTIDHCGMHDVICERCGVKIPITNYSKLVSHLSEVLNDLIDNIDKLKELSHGTYECAQNFKWEERISFWNNMYDLAIDEFYRNGKSEKELK